MWWQRQRHDFMHFWDWIFFGGEYFPRVNICFVLFCSEKRGVTSKFQFRCRCRPRLNFQLLSGLWIGAVFDLSLAILGRYWNFIIIHQGLEGGFDQIGFEGYNWRPSKGQRAICRKSATFFSSISWNYFLFQMLWFIDIRNISNDSYLS